MKIFIVLAFCGVALSAPTCNYSQVDTKYVCLMNNSTASTTDTIEAPEGSITTADIYRVTTLDPANKDLIKKVLETFEKLEVLQIQKGDIDSIDENDFGQCTALKQLQIWNGNISTIGSSNIFQACSLLEEIDLSGNKLEKLDDGSLSANIKKLILDNNKVNPSIKESTLFGTDGLPILTHLSLSGNGISDMTTFNIPTTALIHLDFSRNQITEFPVSKLNKNPKIQNLYLNDNNLTAISDTFLNLLTELKDLKLGSNKISSINVDAFKSNINLLSLDISVNPIKVLNDTLLKSVVSLTSLDIHDIQLEASSYEPLKVTLEALTNLQILDISSNLIGTVDALFIKNINLLDLSISNMNLKQFSNETFSTLIKLQNLTFSSNEIAEFPETIFEKTTEMKRLIGRGNKVDTLKASTFANMKNLEVLDFTSNKINKIEKTFFDQFTSLKEVRFASNECINEDFIPFDKSDESTMAKFKKCFDNYNSARAIVISNILLVFVVIALKFM